MSLPKRFTGHAWNRRRSTFLEGQKQRKEEKKTQTKKCLEHTHFHFNPPEEHCRSALLLRVSRKVSIWIAAVRVLSRSVIGPAVSKKVAQTGQ